MAFSPTSRRRNTAKTFVTLVSDVNDVDFSVAVWFTPSLHKTFLRKLQKALDGAAKTLGEKDTSHVSISKQGYLPDTYTDNFDEEDGWEFDQWIHADGEETPKYSSIRLDICEIVADTHGVCFVFYDGDLVLKTTTLFWDEMGL